jgi:hypothetical protein
MHCYKKTKQLLCICLLAFLATSANAASSSLNIRSADLVVLEDDYVLNADIDVKFTEEVEQAVNKGFELNFLIEFQLMTPRKYWFDDEIITQSQYLTMSYHALSRQYLVVRNGRQQSFANLQQAKEEISNIKTWSVVDKKLLKKGETYIAAIKVRLDQTKLPKPVQVEAIGSDDWNIASERYRWTPVIAF